MSSSERPRFAACTIVQMGKGDREAPAPFVVSVPDVAQKVGVMSTDVPKVDFPLPTGENATANDDTVSMCTR